MARIKKEEENNNLQQEDFYKNLAKNLDGLVLSETDSCPGFIDSNILAVNFIISGKFIGGGFPVGTLVEVSGESGGGKTLLGTNFLKGCQTKNGISVFHDTENALNKEFCILASKLDPEKLVITDSPTIKGSFNKIHKVIRHVREESKIPMDRFLGIVYDSLSVSGTDRELVEVSIDMEAISQAKLKALGGGNQTLAERAREISAELRKILPVAKKNNACVLFVNQLRNKIGGYIPEKTSAAGGMSLPYYCSTRLIITPSTRLKTETGKFFGMKVNFRTVKTRFTSPFQSASSVYLYFEKGIEPFGGLLELLLQNNRIESSSAGNYRVLPAYSNGKEVKFKAAKERNTVPLDVLLDCPALVDGKSGEEVLFYAKLFGDAIDAENEIEEEENIVEME